MDKQDLDAIATREAHCKPYGASVTLSIGERDELVALARDGMRYRWLRDHECCSLSLERDSDHAANYLSAAEWIDAIPEQFRDDPTDEVELMKSTNTIWRLQVYPSTPIGFWVLHRATLDAAIDVAMSEVAKRD